MKSKKLTAGLFAFYFLALTWIILFKMQFSWRGLPHLRGINLIPFGASLVVNGRMNLGEIIQNALAFVPFGIFMRVLLQKSRWPCSLFPSLPPAFCLRRHSTFLPLGPAILQMCFQIPQVDWPALRLLQFLKKYARAAG